jgi:hypothetical protein
MEFFNRRKGLGFFSSVRKGSAVYTDLMDGNAEMREIAFRKKKTETENER